METSGKPEINIEICTGFFRIPTEKAIYNITVLGSDMSSGSRIIEKIVEKEKGVVSKLDTAPGPVSDRLVVDGDDFYKAVSKDIYRDIGNLAKSLSSTIMEIPAEDRRGKRVELDEAGEKIEDAKKQLKDIVAMTEKATMEIMDQVESVQGQTNEVADLLSVLRNHKAFGGSADADSTGGEELPPLTEEITEIQECVTQASGYLNDIIAGGGASPEAAIEKKPASKRFLFDLDNVFQTIYELCTNETVKGHITSAREKAAEIFDKEVFIDNISPLVSEMEPEEGFITVPLSNVLAPLYGACSDKSITNLLKKMDTNQDSIFLDQSIPLEVPEIEEVIEETGMTQAGQAADESLREASQLLKDSLSKLEELSERLDSVGSEASHNDMSMMTLEDQEDIFNKIENALNMATNIRTDICRITEALSFQDLSGQQIMKIIKLLSDFQVQLLAIVVSFGSQLKSKEKNAQLTLDESKALAQEEVDSYFGQIVEKSEEEEGLLDQDSVNKILEDMGF